MENYHRAKEIVDFSTSLFLAQSQATGQSSVSTNLTNFSALTSKLINWKDVLKLYSDHFSLSDIIGLNFPKDYSTVFVADLKYYQTLAKLLANTPRHVLLNFLGAYFTLTYSDFGDSNLQEIAQKYVKVVEDTVTTKPLWSRCLRKIRFHFDYAISKMFIEEHQLASLKGPVEQIVEEIKNSFLEIINNQTATYWIDNTSRRRVLDKINTLNVKVLSPDWVLNDRKIDEFYGFNSPGSSPPSIKKSHFLESFLNLERYYQSAKVKKSLSSASTNLEKWPSSLTSVNAYAEWTSSTICMQVKLYIS